MAKATSGSERSAKEKAAAPAASLRKKAGPVAQAAKKTVAPAAKKAIAPPAKKPVAKKAEAKKPVPVKTAAKSSGSSARSAATAKAKQRAAQAPGPVKKTAAKKEAATQVAPKKSVAAKKFAPAKQAAPANKAAAKPAPAGKTTASVAPARTVAVTKAAPRRPAVRVATPIPAARRARTTAAPRKAPAPAASGKPSAPASSKPIQVFTVSHLKETDFKADSLRPYALYRDLGIAAASSGLCQAHVIRFVPPCTNAVRKRHVHQVDLQLVYVLKGWMKNEFEGHGEQMMSAGSCWLQPTGIAHTVLDYSPDCEVLEIIVPADFSTEDAA
jgi:hypothetical protein